LFQKKESPQLDLGPARQSRLFFMEAIMKSRLLFILRVWLPIVVTIACVIGIVYYTFQQDFQSQLKEPLVQTVKEAALDLGSSPAFPDESAIEKVDIATEDVAFYIVYDPSGKTMFATGSLDGKTPALPDGVFAKVKLTGHEQFTWQPKPGVRLSAVIQKFEGINPGFVLAAIPLRSIEAREGAINGYMMLAGGVSAFITLVVVALVSFIPGSLPRLEARREEEVAEEAEESTEESQS
jgi:hypothetical protein